MIFPLNRSSTLICLCYLAAIVNLIKCDNSSCIVMTYNEFCLPKMELKQVTFHFYTRETANKSFVINFTNIEEAPFLPSTPLKVLIHGYTGWKDYSPNMELRPAYFKKANYNLLSIDWGPLAKEGCYIEATHNVQPVGECVARMLEKIVEVRKDVAPQDVHVVGFSLGAHVAGYIGKSLTAFRITRITGLDPALPLFDKIFNSGSSLGEGDADFVDVIHTNAGMKGKSADVGHVDFYANGGSIQPGCAATNTSCHHVRSVEIFAESINSDIGFYGFKCGSFIDYMTDCCVNVQIEPGEGKWVLLGEYVLRTSRGQYYFDTSDHPLLAKGKTCQATSIL
uniref:Seminal fluid protein n=1 Tax=Nilaparvata lugens TaxID=108931 RepID=A0A1I9WLB3_NILLU|nr:seminal fluid protein [Nilaparvata lugens]